MHTIVWRGPFASPDLVRAADELRDALQAYPAKSRDTAIVVGAQAHGWPVDLVVMGTETLAVVALHDADGPVVARRQGPWTDDRGPQPADRPTPHARALVGRLALLAQLRDVTPKLLGETGDALAWRAADVLVAVRPTLAPGSRYAETLLGRDDRIIGATDLARYIWRLPSRHAPLSPDSIATLIRDGLGAERDGNGAAPAAAPCFLCRGERCDLWRLRGEVTAVRRLEENRVALILALGPIMRPTTLYLNAPWNQMADGLQALLDAKRPNEPGPTIVAHHLRAVFHRGRVHWRTVDASAVIVQPELLVDVSAVASMATCPMAYVISQCSPKTRTLPIVKGTVTHAALGHLLAGESVEDALTAAIAASSLDIALGVVSESAVRAEAEELARRIPPLLPRETRALTETSVVSPTLGLAGRTDAIWEADGVISDIFELKTGKPLTYQAEWAPQPEHRLQAQLYAALHWQAGRLRLEDASATVAYAGIDGGFLARAPLTWPDIRRAILTRNEAVLFDLTGKPFGSPFKCRSCAPFRRNDCSALGDLLGLKPDLTTPDADRKTYRMWLNALRRDAALTASHVAQEAQRPIGERLATGACLRIDRIEEEYETPGKWKARLRAVGIARFRPGDRIALTDDDPVAGRRQLAEVVALLADGLVITADTPARWATLAHEDPLGSMLQANLQSLTAWHTADPRLRRLVAGDCAPSFGPLPPPAPSLDPFQADAAARALAAHDYLLIWGPPGAGKTRTIAQIVRAVVRDGRRVLVSAFTNQAVDTLALAIQTAGERSFLLLGRQERTIDELNRYVVSALGADSAAIARALATCPVVIATAHTVATGRYDRAFIGGAETGAPFDLVIVDEAGQLTEPATLGAIRLGRRFVLVGDHQQLPPIVADPESPLARSLFARLWETPIAASARAMLNRQYRMRAAIAAYPSARWYDGKLETAPSAEARPPVQPPAAVWPAVWRDDWPAVFVDLQGGATEADIIAVLVNEALAAGVPLTEIGVVAPYRQQVAAIGQTLRAALPQCPAIDTVDRFQGSERDVILLALGSGRAGDRGDLLADSRRLNVALTRARRKLIVLGAAAALAAHPEAGPLVQHFAERGAITPVGDGLSRSGSLR